MGFRDNKVGLWLRKNWRKIVASILLVLPSTVLLQWIKEELLRSKIKKVVLFVTVHILHTNTPTRFQLFFLATLMLFVVSFFLMLEPGRWRTNVLDFIRLFLSRAFIGELSTSLYGLLVFVFFAVILTQWLPNALQMGDTYYTAGSILYFLSLVFMSAFVYPAPRKAPSSSGELPPKVKYAFYPLSGPAGWERVSEISCECLKRNALDDDSVGCREERPPNIVPVFLSLYNQLCRVNSGQENDGNGEEVRLRKVFLGITDIHLKKEENEKGEEVVLHVLSEPIIEFLRGFFKKVSECVGENCERPRFLVRWYGRNEEPEVIGDGGHEVQVEFVYLGSGNDLMKAWNALRGNEELQDIMENESGDIVFHLTSGTAVISAAVTLEAVRGDAHMEYIVQGKYNIRELLKQMDVSIFELDDLVEEIKKYFERQYEKTQKENRG